MLRIPDSHRQGHDNRNRVGVYRVLVFLVAALCVAAASAEQPNIVLLLVDDMGHGDIAAHGKGLRTSQEAIATAHHRGMDRCRYPRHADVYDTTMDCAVPVRCLRHKED